MNDLARSYAAYSKHYDQYAAKYGMEVEKYEPLAYADAYRLYKEKYPDKSHWSNIPRDIALNQTALSYEEALSIARNARAKGKKLSVKELRGFNDKEYKYKDTTANSLRQGLYLSLLADYGSDFADEFFGY